MAQTFGALLRQLRTQRGLTQSDLAGPGISASYLSMLEHGKRKPTPHVIAALTAAGASDGAVVGDTDGVALEVTVGDEVDDVLAAGVVADVAAVVVLVEAEQPVSVVATSTTTSGTRRDPTAAATRRGYGLGPVHPVTGPLLLAPSRAVGAQPRMHSCLPAADPPSRNTPRRVRGRYGPSQPTRPTGSMAVLRTEAG